MTMTGDSKVVFVTGASRGIGRAVALRCAKDGTQLILSARTLESLNATRDACIDQGAPEPDCVGLDFATDADASGIFQNVLKRHGRLDGLVNNAGVMHEGLLGMIGARDIDRVLSINVRAPLVMTQYAARLMARRSAGSIVNITSIMGTQGAAGLTLYAMSKAALVGMTLSASKELAPQGIRVNAIAPGFIDTDMTRSMPESTYRTRLQSVGLGRAGTSAEVAELVTFLLSDKAAYISGQVVGIDGRMVV